MKASGTPGRPVGIWIRVSTEDQAKGESPEHHEKRARAYAEAHGWNVREVYHLEGVSGKTVAHWPEAERMLRDIKRKHIDALVFSKLARLARNTRELLDYSDQFREAGADLISLQESIDTSSPAGRLFFTMIAAMAQWEREEIVERINASIKIRAQLGKSLGGPAPYGYQWKDRRLQTNAAEGPVRKLMYEHFREHKRIKAVARLLNDAGYRTRNGSEFTDTTILRLVQDTTAKGIYRANHTYRDDKGKLHLKPKADWIETKVEPLVSEELWNQCNAILDQRKADRPAPGPTPVHLFAGLIYCGCGAKMYVFSRSPKYVCPKCKTKIPAEDMESIFRDQLKSFFVSEDEVKKHLKKADETLREKEERLDMHRREIQKVKAEMQKTHRLYLDDKLTSDGFGDIYKPLEEQHAKLADELPKLEAEIDLIKMSQLSADEVISEAIDLYRSWPKLSIPEKRKLIESITEKIVVSEDSVDITLSYMPTCEELTKRQRNLWGSWPPPA
jgi:site-specific DNA recombinase